MAADLAGRAALVTGAASGIGRASAIAFAAAGASVALVDIDADGLAATAASVKAAGQHAEVFVADVTDLRAVTTAVEGAAGFFGRLDAAHNTAGVPGTHVPLGGIAEPEEIAGAAVWPCSPQASYITGSVLVADGGWLAG